jgi:hypothetical protein
MNLPLFLLVAFHSGITVTFNMIVLSIECITKAIFDLKEGLKTSGICGRTDARLGDNCMAQRNVEDRVERFKGGRTSFVMKQLYA